MFQSVQPFIVLYGKCQRYPVYVQIRMTVMKQSHATNNVNQTHLLYVAVDMAIIFHQIRGSVKVHKL